MMKNKATRLPAGLVDSGANHTIPVFPVISSVSSLTHTAAFFFSEKYISSHYQDQEQMPFFPKFVTFFEMFECDPTQKVIIKCLE